MLHMPFHTTLSAAQAEKGGQRGALYIGCLFLTLELAAWTGL